METIDYAVTGHVATITLARPECKNAINADMRRELTRAVGLLRRDEKVRVLVLRGAGDDFCSGGDVRTMQGDIEAEHGRARLHEAHIWLKDLFELDKPVIAAIDGAAYGAGFGLALAADLVLTTPRARYGISFLRLGLIPDFGLLHTLPRIIGVQRSKQLMLSTRELSGDEAYTLGIAAELLAPKDLHMRANEIALALAEASPVAVSLIKRALHSTFERDLSTTLCAEADGQGIAFASNYRREATSCFIEKRPLRFSWPEAKPGTFD